jgi:hypothetical protein
MSIIVSRCSASSFFFLLLTLCIGLFGCGGGTSQSGGGNPPPPPPVPGVSYAPPISISSAGTHAGSLAIADFNGDGKLDIAVSNFDSNTVAVFLNQGGGTFAAPIINTIQITNGLGPIVLGDFNEDGKPDLIAATVAGPQVDLVLLGNGDGTFTQSAAIPNSFGFLHGRVADLNGDKHLDLIGCSNGNMSVALGNGDGTFQSVVYLPNGPFPDTYFGCDVGDFNGDKKLDILGANFSGDPNLVLFAGNGDGTFQAPAVISSGSSDPVSISAADFNGDSKLDVLVGFDAGFASLFLGNGAGSFGGPVTVYFNSNFNGNGVVVLAADLNNDGKPDALVTDYTHGIFTIELNTGSGISRQSKTYTYNLAAGLSDIAVGDLNGDGIPDIVLVNSQTDHITIFLSQK